MCLIVFAGFLVFLQRKHPGNIESEMDITLFPLAGRSPYKFFSVHTKRVSEKQLEHMSSRFNIKTYRERIIYLLAQISFWICYVVIFQHSDLFLFRIFTRAPVPKAKISLDQVQ